MKSKIKLAAILALGLLVIVLIRCKKENHIEVKPSIAQLNESQVIISWESSTANDGKVYYKVFGTNAKERSVSDKFGKTQHHEAEIKGLQPATKYSYWIEGMKNKYWFTTKPIQSAPFSFMVTSDQGNQDYLSILQTESCSFIISFKGTNSKTMNICAPYVPILKKEQKEWSVDWAGLHLVVLQQDADLASVLDAPGSHTTGMLVKPEVIGNIDAVENSAFHKKLLSFNDQDPNTPVSFVGILESNKEMLKIDEITYIGLAQGKNSSELSDFTFTLNVDIESTSAFFISENREVLLKEPPLQGKRTCQECRRLAEKGAYEESIMAYKQFIKSHKGHYQIDDAYFAIAEIYDGKLFQFPLALEWYNLLINDFPSSNMVPLANQRINYITNYNEANYEPLAAFEKIKTYEFAKAKNSKVNQVEVLEKLAEVVAQYPNTKLAPVMQLWMANQYQLINVEKSIAIYNNLRKHYPEFSLTHEVLVKIGETYYNNELWSDANIAYSEVANVFPELKETTDAQLRRIKRNLKRIKLNYISLSILIVTFLVLLFLPPFGFKHPGWIALAAGFFINFVILFFFCWMYREEFASLTEMLLLIFAFLISIFLGVISAYTFSRKLFLKHNLIAKITGNILGIIIFLCGFYQGIYNIYIHYLVAVGW